MRLVQLQSGPLRRVAVVEEPNLRLLAASMPSVYALARAALARGETLETAVQRHRTGQFVNYDRIYHGEGDWLLLASIDHPDDPAHCLVSGTGLTHLGSAQNRDAMHTEAKKVETDSMRMFRWGLEGGKPPAGQVGVAPEWFYKGGGTILRAPGAALEVPAYAESGGEEGEIAGVYVIASDGQPWRIGMCIGNEFSDHRFERRNYLNLAGSKIRTCALGPELVIDAPFQSVAGRVTIERAGRSLWSQAILTGEAEMCHSLANIEHHHFKYGTHRQPGDVHVHYYGACSLSSGAGITLADGDIMTIAYTGFGRPLRNPVRVLPGPEPLVTTKILQ